MKCPSLAVLFLLLHLQGGAPDWVVQQLGENEVRSVSLQQAGLSLRASGRESYVGLDEGTFAGFRTEDRHFRFTARIAGTKDVPAQLKVGIVVREGLGGKERCVNLRYDGYEKNQCLQ